MAVSWSRWNLSTVGLIVANVLIPVAVLTFATGFFPYKPFVPGLADFEELDHGSPPAAQFDKLVFMVVDALRSDFVYSHNSGFKFTQSLIRSGEALPFTAHATSPTITMPRVKAITTGSIPSFLDVILNFAESDTTSTLASQDTWLAQIKDKLGRKDGSDDTESEGGTLVMYGDDTWLKLFPDMFARSDGTSSFFVSDFTEVDNNVTRHVPHELRTDDWNAMIMHYLGLDHIGHKAGPLSPNMIPKQQEMDGVVQQIYEAMTSMAHLQSTLLVLCGDHGMNDGGNHGGSAPGETSPALVFISPKLKRLSRGKESPTSPKQDFEFYSVIEQSDVAPTIAGLLGVPVPLNNLGVFIQDFLPLWVYPMDRVQLLLRNARQMLKIVEATFPSTNFKYDMQPDSVDDSDSFKLAHLWFKANQALQYFSAETKDSDIYLALDTLYQFCREAQDVMSSTASNYDVGRLNMGIAFSAVSVLFGLLVAWNLPIWHSDGAFLALTTLLYGVMMFASSYVEEEQHFWYWITGGWIAYLSCIKSATITHRLGYLLVLALLRISQRWNQTGQKFAGAPDIVHDVLTPHPILLWVLVALTYLVLLYQIGNHFVFDLKSHAAIGTAGAIVLVIPAFVFKLGFTASEAPELLSWVGNPVLSFLKHTPLVGSARAIFLTLVSETLWACSAAANTDNSTRSRRKLPQTLLALLTLFLVTQSRTPNIPLFFIYFTQYELLTRLSLTPVQITITSLLLGQASFFALGNSNAISSIDLSNAYNGVSGYNVLAVGILVFLSNWAGPVWWSVCGITLLISRTHPHAEEQGNVMEKRREWVKMEMDNLLSPERKDDSASGEHEKTSDRPFFTYATLLTLCTSASLLAVMVACTILRTHLFIWTVFSPKYLYTMAWSLAYHSTISLGLCGAIWRFCAR